MKKRLNLILFGIIIAILTCALLVACNDQVGGNDITPIDGENPNATQPAEAIVPDFGEGVTSAQIDFPLATLLADLNVNVATDKILESNCTSYTGVSESAVDSYMEQYVAAGWTNSNDGIFFKGSTIVALTFDRNNDFLIIEVQFTADVAETIRSALVGEQGGSDEPATLSSITLNTEYVKKAYVIGEELNTDGLSISERMSDSTDRSGAVSDYTVDSENAFDANVVGTYTIRVTNKTNSAIYAEYQVTVSLRVMEGVDSDGVGLQYDGEAHSIVVENIPEGATVTYSEDTAENKTYSAENPSYTLPTDITVYYKVSKAGYEDYKGSAKLYIYEATFAPGTISVASYTGDFDGEAHRASVIELPEDALITFSTDSGANKTYGVTNPAFTDAGEYTVYYKVTKTGYATEERSTTVKINKAGIDGISAQGFIGIAGDEASITVTGTTTGDVIEYGELVEGNPVSYSTTNIVKNTACDVTIQYRVSRGVNYEQIGTATISLVPDVELAGITLNGITKYWVKDFEHELSKYNVEGILEGDILYFSTDGVGNWTEHMSAGYEEPGSYTVYMKLLRIGEGYYEASANIVVEKLDYEASTVSGIGTTRNVRWTEGMTYGSIAEYYDFADAGITVSNPDTAVVVGTYSNVAAVYNFDPAHYNDYPMSFTFVVAPKLIPTGDIAVSDVEVVYDGQPHGAAVSGNNVSAYDVYFCVANTDEWVESLTYVNVKMDANLIGEYRIEWKAERANYETATGYASIKITQATYAVGVITHDDVTTTYTDGLEYYDMVDLLDEGFAWDVSSLTTKVNVTDSVGIDQDIIYTGNDNYAPYTLTIKLIVNPATMEGITANSIERDYAPSNPYGHLYTVSVPETITDYTVWFSLSNSPYDWKSSLEITSTGLKDAGVYTVYYKVSRANYNDFIGSATVTVKKLSQTFSVVAPSNLGYNGSNKVVTINAGDARGYTLSYCETADGEYSTTAPTCIMPGAYSFYVKPISNNYSFNDIDNSSNDYALAEFTIVKGDYEWEDTLHSHNSGIIDHIEGIAGEDKTYSFDVNPIIAAINAIGITNTEDYSIKYSLDNGATYVTTAPTFSEACVRKKVIIRVTTSLYNDVDYTKYVTLIAIQDVTGEVGVATDASDVIGYFPQDTSVGIEYSLDNKETWLESDYSNNYAFDAVYTNLKVYYRVTTYVFNEESADPEGDWEVDEVYIYFFYVTTTAVE